VKKTIMITDLTRMREGRVCIAGYDARLGCVRPVLRPPGIQECALFAGGRPIVFPGAEVEFDCGQSNSHPPHTEDLYFNSGAVRLKGRLNEERWRHLLSTTLSANVAAIFGQPIHTDHGAYVHDGQGTRSLGTIRPSSVTNAVYKDRAGGRWEYRIGFVDGAGSRFDLPVTDLAWRYFMDFRRAKGHVAGDIAVEMAELLRQRAVFLRIGLARGWAERPGECYLQITGVHTFPDYLLGLTFADYAPLASMAAPATAARR
jgi:hypothetical protein